LSVQLVPALGWNLKSPSASSVTEPPSALATVPATTTSGPGPSTSESFERIVPATVLAGPEALGAPSVASLTTSVVLPIAPFAPLKLSAPATGASFTQVTVIDTVAVEPPLSVYVKVSFVVPGGSLQ
jgi:hypothetical protein